MYLNSYKNPKQAIPNPFPKQFFYKNRKVGTNNLCDGFVIIKNKITF